MPTAKPARNRKATKLRAEPSAAYWKLCRRFPLRPISTEAELDAATRIIDELVDRGFDDLDPWEDDYLDALGTLTRAYEQEQHPIEPASDGEMFEFLCDQRRVTQRDVAAATGIVNTTLSAVVHGKRKFTRDHIRRLADYFHVHAGVFE